ncbi:flagellar basal body P-ring formation protein FlgA [Allopusillimonas soli]|uniref:Flagella basal body P-ring formation protein FlgA n=1 Tax=Allopusillimonas soli TaxID=659016 RepID=A0A853F6C5_9BURK|nr:flagellar basal body P-ring formation chaperone FlgA [Allopusillimonas soli]NYT35529.1 flagellar basal body P-ring formation protein FlgA [Allopusillimonas soli]TEA75935.1 flagellar basal body P-ring formation protein FlgA [Allopusillimonas soli]
MFRRSLLILPLAAAPLCAALAAGVPSGHASQDPAIVAARVHRFLLEQAGGSPDKVHIAVQAPRVGRYGACGRLQLFTSGAQHLRPRMTVGVRCMQPSWTTYVQASVSVQGSYYVAGRSIQAGETLGRSDLEERQGNILRLPRGVVLDPAQAVGYVAAQRIGAGSPVKTRMLRDPDAIQRGQRVRTEARGRGFVATGEGQALESGPPGAIIQVKASSGEIISGTVIDAHTVRVAM